jgi:hypothetical protein
VTPERAIDVARRAAEARGLVWRSPAEARRHGRLLGRPYWEVISNAEARGSNVVVRLGMDESVLDVSVRPR